MLKVIVQEEKHVCAHELRKTLGWYEGIIGR